MEFLHKKMKRERRVLWQIAYSFILNLCHKDAPLLLSYICTYTEILVWLSSFEYSIFWLSRASYMLHRSNKWDICKSYVMHKSNFFQGTSWKSPRNELSTWNGFPKSKTSVCIWVINLKTSWTAKELST